MAEASRWAALDPHIPRDLRERLEESLWRPIEARSTLEVLQEDPGFLANPGSHPAMFADHGVVHARDVAAGLVHLMERMNGLFLPARPPERVALMQTLGVAIAYIHDVGMVDMTPVGRATTPCMPRTSPSRPTSMCSPITSCPRVRCARPWTRSSGWTRSESPWTPWCGRS